MRLEAQIIVTNGVTGPDADASPEDVTSDQILNVQSIQNFGDVPGRTLLLALEAPETESVTVDLWHGDENAEIAEAGGVFPDKAGSRYWRFATAVVCTGNRLQTVTCHVGGRIYAQVTGDTIAASESRRLRATCVV